MPVATRKAVGEGESGFRQTVEQAWGHSGFLPRGMLLAEWDLADDPAGT
jgi:hypothetical protein